MIRQHRKKSNLLNLSFLKLSSQEQKIIRAAARAKMTFTDTETKLEKFSGQISKVSVEQFIFVFIFETNLNAPIQTNELSDLSPILILEPKLDEAIED